MSNFAVPWLHHLYFQIKGLGAHSWMLIILSCQCSCCQQYVFQRHLHVNWWMPWCPALFNSLNHNRSCLNVETINAFTATGLVSPALSATKYILTHTCILVVQSRGLKHGCSLPSLVLSHAEVGSWLRLQAGVGPWWPSICISTCCQYPYRNFPEKTSLFSRVSF